MATWVPKHMAVLLAWAVLALAPLTAGATGLDEMLAAIRGKLAEGAKAVQPAPNGQHRTATPGKRPSGAAASRYSCDPSRTDPHSLSDHDACAMARLRHRYNK